MDPSAGVEESVDVPDKGQIYYRSQNIIKLLSRSMIVKPVLLFFVNHLLSKRCIRFDPPPLER